MSLLHLLHVSDEHKTIIRKYIQAVSELNVSNPKK